MTAQANRRMCEGQSTRDRYIFAMNICPAVSSIFPLRGVQTLRGLALALLVLLTASCGDSGREAMVSTANPYASEAALDILKQGGSAVDAAIAAQLVLSLVEPQSSGIGGGAFMLHWDEGSDRVDAYDGRETAPAAAGPDLFLHDDGTPMGFMEAVVGGRAVGVPGVVALLWEAHQDHGRLDWEDVLAPAIRLAETGFKVSQRLHDMIASHNTPDRIADDPALLLHRIGRGARRLGTAAGGVCAQEPILCEHVTAHRQRGTGRIL